MPRRPRDRRSRRDASNGGTAGTSGGAPGGRIRASSTDKARFVEDPLGAGTAELRRVQPYQANKTYICPGCNQEIRPGTAHVVIVPLADPTGRRHWHSPCWEFRARRRPTGR